MHELSIVMSVVGIAESEARNSKAKAVERIELDIGRLAGVDYAAFDFAWRQGIKGSILSSAECVINRIPGRGQCLYCDAQFEINNLYDACPECGKHLINVTSGKELSVKRMIVNQ